MRSSQQDQPRRAPVLQAIAGPRVAAILAVAIGFVVAGLQLTGSLDFLEHRLQDLRFGAHPRAASGQVVVVAIDPPSLSTLDVWPWPRGYHATVLDNLIAAGARRVAFDIDFSSRSNAGEDAELARALAAAGHRAILPVFDQHRVRPGDGPGPDRPAVHRTGPLPELRRHVTLASINIRPDPDGLVRHYGSDGADSRVAGPGLAWALAESPAGPERPFQIDFGIVPGSVPVMSYLDVLTDTFEHSLVGGRDVIIGATAVELGDHVAVPVYAAIPGVLVQALATESLLQGRALDPTAPWVPLVLALIVGACFGPLFDMRSWRGGAVILVAVVTGLHVLATAFYITTGWMIQVVPAALVGIGLFAVALVRRVDTQSLRLAVQTRSIQRKEVLFQRVMESSFDAIVTVDAEGCVETCNGAASQMFRYPGAELIGLPLDGLMEGESPGFCNRPPGLPAETVGRRRDGTTFPLELVVSEISIEDQRLRVALLRDITERREQQAALQHQAFHDALTDLPNRFLLQDRMENALATARDRRQPVAFLILDLDRFKEVNDTLGHHIGDQLLQMIANRLQDPLRSGDTIARLGGDEFAVLLPGTDLAGAFSTARDFLDALERPFDVQGFSLQIGASIGVALFPDHGRDAYLLLQRADVAMYVAKRERAGVAVYDPHKDDHSLRQLTLTGELKQAIELNNFVLCYQPKLSCLDGRPVGMEALVRWQHPRHGLLSPDEFITLAENTGLIRPLTYWIFNTAADQYAAWRRAGIDIPLAINLSAESLRERDLPGNLAEILERRQLLPEHLILEITESVLMEDPERSMEIVTALHDLGIGISIDDFGTGYSSLAYLKRLPAKELKIDRSFVLDLDHNPDDVVIVRSTVDLAHNLGLSVVAEGIETEPVWERLQQMGCDAGQGYLFSEPVTADRFLDWYREHRAGSGRRGKRLSLVPTTRP